jgi:putative addiction module antidote
MIPRMTKKPKNPGVADGERRPFKADAPARTAGRTLKVRRVGNSLGVVLPKEVLAKLRVGEGDELTVTDTPDGVALQHFDAELQEQIDAARRAMKRYRNALRELAK